MKFKHISVLLLSVALLFMLTTSYMTGPANRGHDKTGSPLSDGVCMNCHSSGSFSPSLLVSLMDGDTEVKSYEAGKQYTLHYQLINLGSPAVFGFQTVALNANNENAGTFENIPDGFNVVSLKEVDYLEHKSPRPISSFEVNWTAPESGDDVIRIFSGGVAANGNQDTGGDGADLDTLLLPANTAKTDPIFAATKTNDLFDLRTNLVSDQLQLKTKYNLNQIRIFDLSGQVHINTKPPTVFSNEVNIPVHVLHEGLYFVQCSSNGKQQTSRFYKS